MAPLPPLWLWMVDVTFRKHTRQLWSENVILCRVSIKWKNEVCKKIWSHLTPSVSWDIFFFPTGDLQEKVDAVNGFHFLQRSILLTKQHKSETLYDLYLVHKRFAYAMCSRDPWQFPVAWTHNWCNRSLELPIAKPQKGWKSRRRVRPEFTFRLIWISRLVEGIRKYWPSHDHWIHFEWFLYSVSKLEPQL